MPVPAITSGEAIMIIVFAAIPVAALMFALGAGRAFDQIGKGQFAIDREAPPRPGASSPTSGAAREAEIRQLLEAKAFRQRERGESPLDVEAELARLLAQQHRRASAGADPALREEVRQLVLARNRRRERRGEPPLEVEAEIERQLRDLDDLGQ